LQVRISDPAFVYDLLDSLRTANYMAAKTTSATIEVVNPAKASPERGRLHLGFYLANWQGRHPGVSAEIESTPALR
jgi:hypothetical protein